LGWQIADRLSESVADESTKVLAVHQLAPELAEPISEADLVIFIDASYDGEPGSWRCEAIAPDAVSSNALAHHFTPVSLLGYANAIFQARPRSLLFSAAAESFECGEKLTSKVAEAVPEIVHYLCKQISWFSQISKQSYV
jgi:hydrogenase maturation protease